MKRIKLLAIMGMISVLCVTQVQAQSPDIWVEIPNQLDSLIRESIIMSNDLYYEGGNTKPYFMIKDGMPKLFDIESLAKELGVQLVTFGELYKNRVMGNYTKPNGKVIAKNFAKDFRARRGRYDELLGGRCVMELQDISIDNIYIYIYIYNNGLRKTSKGWMSAIGPNSMNRYCYKYSPEEKKWNLVDIVQSSGHRVPPPIKGEK